jgi:hypothetical protein
MDNNQLQSVLAVCADSPATLRAVDLYRLQSECTNRGNCWDQMCTWLFTSGELSERTTQKLHQLRANK